MAPRRTSKLTIVRKRREKLYKSTGIITNEKNLVQYSDVQPLMVPLNEEGFFTISLTVRKQNKNDDSRNGDDNNKYNQHGFNFDYNFNYEA